MYILQQCLFSFEELQKIESKDRLPLFFGTLDLRSYAKELRSLSPQGPDGHDRQAILRALLIAPFEKISTFSALHKRLKNDLRFRYQCGLSTSKSAPSIATLSRVFKQLVEKNVLETLFYDLVRQCRAEGIIKDANLAIDSSAIEAYEKKKTKTKCKDSPNATWGAKYDTFRNKITWFGYKIHLAVDADTDLPVAVEVTGAHVNDGDMAPILIEKALSTSQEDKLKYVMMDAGYDQLKNYEAAKKHGAQAIIPLNLRNEKEPPAGFTSNGTACCSMGYEMVYWGADKKYLKFRCPHILGKVDCPQGSNWCSSSSYGLVTKVNVNEDLRRFCLPHRNTKNWELLYDKRTSVERSFARLKEHLTANDLHVRGIQKVKSYIFLNAIILLSSALAIKNTNLPAQKAS